MTWPTRCGAETLHHAQQWRSWKEEAMESEVYEVTHAPNGPATTMTWRVTTNLWENDNPLIAYCYTREDAERIAALLNAEVAHV